MQDYNKDKDNDNDAVKFSFLYDISDIIDISVVNESISIRYI